ncbi:MAG: hypothetical protein Q8M65_00375 [Rhodoglobus sp.]|nr:hypothetical protein [Rhodoglobus sp.]
MRVISLAAVATSVVLALSLAACQIAEEPNDSDSADSAPAESVAATPTPDSSRDIEEAAADDSASSNAEDSSGSTSAPVAPAPAPSPSATPPPAPPAPSGPTVALTNQRCSGGKLLITLTANADNSYRKGISKVVLERQNEYNAWIDSDASWLGPETGQGNQWTGNLPGNTQNIGKTLRVTVKGSTGTTTITAPVTASC